MLAQRRSPAANLLDRRADRSGGRNRIVIRWSTGILLSLLLSACDSVDYVTLDGAGGQYDDWRGRWVLVNYWAEWCKPCIEEIPELNHFQKLHGDVAQVFGVNFDGGPKERQQQQAEALQIGFPVLLEDPAPASGWERPKALPTTIVIDPEGRIRAQLQGPQTLADLRAAIGLGSEFD